MRVNALLIRYEGGFREASSTGLTGTDGSPLTTPGGELLLGTSQGAGRIEGFVNYPEDSAVEADRKAASTISTLESARWQTTVGIEPTGSGDIPLTHWDVGDTITVPDQDGSPQVVPVIGLLLTEDEAGHPVYRPQVGDSIPSLDERRSTTARNYNSGDLSGRDRQAQPRTGGSTTGLAAKVTSPALGSTSVNSGQLLVMSATSASIAAGGDHVEFDLIVAQHRFSGVSAPGEGWVHPVTGIYALTYRHAWDSFEGGGTVRLELDGVLVPEGVIMAGSSGREGLGSLFYRATTGSTGKVKVTHGSASAQTCSATIRLAITDPDPVTTSAPAGWDLVFSADAWGMVFDGTNWWTTEGNSGDTVTKRNASGVALDSFDARMGGRGRGITFDGTDLWVTGSHDDTQPTNPSALKRFSTGGVLQETITTVAVGDANMGVVSAGSDLWFTEHGNSKLVKVSGGAVAAQYSVPTNPRGLALYDSRLWLITGGRILRAYNLSGVATGDTVDLSGLTNSPTGVWIDGAGQLYIACDADGVYEYQGVLP